jgi:carboxyl-terminal processing protease
MLRHSHLWTLGAAFVAVACWQAAHSSAPQKEEDAELYRLFVDAVEHVDRSYVQKVERRALVQNAIRGMLEQLDPYSDFISREARPAFEKTTTGHFGGVGIQVDVRNNEVFVISPMVGTPAYEAGVLAGDKILKVDDQAIERIVNDDIVQKISGPPGTEVRLTVQRAPYNGKPVELKLTRQVINVETVRGWMRNPDDSWNYHVDPQKKIAYLRVGGFSATTEADVEKTLKALVKSGDIKGLVLDLRNNPGGLLPAAVRICDMFIKEGKLVSTKGRGQLSERVYNAVEADTLPDFPMAILVNRFSASASEIVSACLQDHNRAVIVGERTWGKGSVQNVIDLEDGKSAIKLTVAGYNRPNGHPIHRFKNMSEKDEWGVKPNEGYDVRLTPEESNKLFLWRAAKDVAVGKRPSDSKLPDAVKPGDNVTDKQLDKALEYVRSKVK